MNNRQEYRQIDTVEEGRVKWENVRHIKTVRKTGRSRRPKKQQGQTRVRETTQTKNILQDENGRNKGTKTRQTTGNEDIQRQNERGQKGTQDSFTHFLDGETDIWFLDNKSERKFATFFVG